MNENRLITSPREKAELFNNFFGNIAQQLADKLPPAQHDPMQFLTEYDQNEMRIPQTSIREVIAIIKTIKNKKCNINDFSPMIIKENAHLLAQPLVCLFNQSVIQGAFPTKLKSAYIIPIFKKGSKSYTNNYRPI